MEEKQKEQLTQKEQNSMLKTIYGYVNSYEKLNGLEVCFESFADSGASLALFSDQGASVIKRFITGGYRGYLPFALIYRSNPKSDIQKLNKIEYLNDLGSWLCDKSNYPDLENIQIEKIEQTSVPFKDNADDAGYNDYIVTFDLYYRKGDLLWP